MYKYQNLHRTTNKIQRGIHVCRTKCIEYTEHAAVATQHGHGTLFLHGYGILFFLRSNTGGNSRMPCDMHQTIVQQCYFEYATCSRGYCAWLWRYGKHEKNSEGKAARVHIPNKKKWLVKIFSR
jgi:hypothetical protein